MLLNDILQPECVKVPLEAVEKYQAITELLDLLDAQGLLRDYDSAYKAVMEREAVRSTGVGHGFAIPHGKCAAIERLALAIGLASHPIDFESIDHKPVRVIILLVSPANETGPHIQALARVSRMMTAPEVGPQVFDCRTADELYRLVTSHENHPAP